MSLPDHRNDRTTGKICMIAMIGQPYTGNDCSFKPRGYHIRMPLYPCAHAAFNTACPDKYKSVFSRLRFFRSV